MTRRIVIAGGSGTIGRHLARLLVVDGDEVDVLSRDPGRAQDHLPPGARAIGWTATATPELAATLAGAAAVVNLAGVAIGPVPWTRSRKRAIRDSRLGATAALVESIGRLSPEERPPVLVNASGTDVYVGLDAAPATESTPPADDFLSRVCLDWEATARGAEPLGVRVALLRQAFVLAADAPVLALFALPFRLFLGGRLGSGRQWFSWIHVDDLVRLYRLLIDQPDVTGIVIGAAPSPCRNSELAAALGRVLGRPSWLPAPARAIRLALGEESTLVLGSRRAAPARALALGFEFRHPDLEPALHDVLGPASD